MNSVTPRQPSLFRQLGGETPLRRLVNTFYDIVDTHPDGEALHRLHLEQGLDGAHLRQVQFEFMCGFLGGPRHYTERTGHANLRRIHEHLAIGPAEVQSWLRCMVHAIEATDVPMEVAPRLMQTFMRAAEVLRNRD